MGKLTSRSNKGLYELVLLMPRQGTQLTIVLCLFLVFLKVFGKEEEKQACLLYEKSELLTDTGTGKIARVKLILAKKLKS